MKNIGKGLQTSGGECTGTLRVAADIKDVVRLMKTDLSDVVLFSRQASATALTPLFAKIKAVVCTGGGATSHLAIVAREFNIPCVMAVNVSLTDEELDGKTVSFNGKGEVFLEQ